MMIKAEEIWKAACEAQMKEVYANIGPDGNTNGHAIKHWTKTPPLPKEYAALKLKEQQQRGGLDEEAVKKIFEEYGLTVSAVNDQTLRDKDFKEAIEAICQLSLPETKSDAVDFGDWINKNEYEKIHGNRWCKPFMSYTHSTQELYDIFLLQKGLSSPTKPVEPNEEELINQFINKLDASYNYKTENERQNIINELYKISGSNEEVERLKAELERVNERYKKCNKSNEMLSWTIKQMEAREITPETLAEAFPSLQEWEIEFNKTHKYGHHALSNARAGARIMFQQAIEKLSGKVMAKESETNKKS